MAEVRVHVDGHGEAAAAGEAEALQNRAPQSAPAAADEDMQAGMAGGELEGHLSGAVWRIVIDDEQLKSGIDG